MDTLGDNAKYIIYGKELDRVRARMGFGPSISCESCCYSYVETTDTGAIIKVCRRSFANWFIVDTHGVCKSHPALLNNVEGM